MEDNQKIEEIINDLWDLRGTLYERIHSVEKKIKKLKKNETQK